MPGDRPLRVALLSYRGNPHSGGQGVYTRHLSRELVALGHHVEVFSGQPWPDVDPEVPLRKVPSLDLYRPDNPFRIPWPSEFHSLADVAEFAIMCTAGFPEPRTFSWRVRRALRPRRADFDIVHDNQCLADGIVGILRDGFPVVATLHHPITVDRDLELAAAKTLRRKLTLHRWYGFLRMQRRVIPQLPRIITVSQSSARDICAQMNGRPEQVAVVPVGVDHKRFRPLPHIARVPGRVMTTTSADAALKGLVPLLEAMAKLRTERDAHLVVIGKPREGSSLPATIERLCLQDAVTFTSGVDDRRIVELYAEAEVAVVPSLYEGFSLPAIEAMACGVPLVATTGGALPEVAGRDGETALLVPPNDPGALAHAIGRLLDDRALRDRIGAAGHERALRRFTWAETARGTLDQYRLELEAHARRQAAAA
jgi:glycosyltransferase involved in cell wall biosynthesis